MVHTLVRFQKVDQTFWSDSGQWTTHYCQFLGSELHSQISNSGQNNSFIQTWEPEYAHRIKRYIPVKSPGSGPYLTVRFRIVEHKLEQDPGEWTTQ